MRRSTKHVVPSHCTPGRSLAWSTMKVSFKYLTRNVLCELRSLDVAQVNGQSQGHQGASVRFGLRWVMVCWGSGFGEASRRTIQISDRWVTLEIVRSKPLRCVGQWVRLDRNLLLSLGEKGWVKDAAVPPTFCRISHVFHIIFSRDL